MTLREALRLVEPTKRLTGTPAPDVEASVGLAPFAPELASPFAPASHLQTFVYPDIYGADVVQPLTRQLAMAIPAVARARMLVCGAIARCPLQVFDGETLLPEQPLWTQRTDNAGAPPPFHRMLWTVDDLMFHGWSLWVARRGFSAAGSTRPLLSAGRVNIGRWRFTKAGEVLVDDKPVNADEVILIPGPHEGILNYGSTALRQAQGLEDQAAARAANPSANTELHDTEGTLTRPEINELVADWTGARRGANGGVAYTPKRIELREHGAAAEQLLIEGRNAAAVNVARLVGLPAAMIDATNATASLTYETTQGRNGEFIDYGLAPYMAAVGGRLSLDDIVPRGQSVRFNTSELRDLAPISTGTPTTD